MCWLRKFMCLLAVVVVLSPSVATAATPFKITMIVFRGCEDACQGFLDYIKTRKIPAQVEVLDADTDSKRLQVHIDTVRRHKPDLLVTWGTTVSLAALGTYDAVDPQRHIVDVPALFMIVSNPVAARLVPNLESSGRNITGTRYLVSEATQLKAARSYMAFKRLAVIYNPQEQNSLLTLANLRELAGLMGFSLIERPATILDGQPDPDSLPGLVSVVRQAGADMLYQPPDSFLLKYRDVLTQAAVAQGLPVLAAAEAPVREAQALMGVVNRYYTVGQLTAAQAEQILISKVAPRDIPIAAPRNFSFIVNMRAALALKRYPPMKVLKIAEVIE